jgi:glucosamine--fructose-6-phosphate aminotransferase (isomerizing)
MCGILGYLGKGDALNAIFSGLEKLAYRGYDSSGVALFDGRDIKVTRAVGKLGELRKLFPEGVSRPACKLGIGHTRWATHGKPSEANAHPHTAGRVSLIHNGIIENYAELREELAKGGAKFTSETDTEIAAHLLNKFLEEGNKPFEALLKTCGEIRGSYAFVAIDKSNPDRLLVAKNATPIVVGIGEDEVIVASDIPAVLDYTRNVVILEDGDIAEIKIGAQRIENHGKSVERKSQRITWDPVTAQKGGFKHYMLKEIFEQPNVIADTYRGRLNREANHVRLEELALSDEQIRKIERVVFVACGTAWHACLVTKYSLEMLAGIPCEVDYASEFRYRKPILNDKTLVVAISQSGETADTLAAIELAGKTSPTLGICNVLGSTLVRKVKYVVYTHAGPEISVASTKAFTTQLIAGLMLAVRFAEARGTADCREIVSSLYKLPAAVQEALKSADEVKALAGWISKVKDVLFLGRGNCYPIALEGALKLKEISYIHAEGYPAGEMKHGPIALIDDRMPVVVVIQRSDVIQEKVISNLREVEARGGQLVVVTDAALPPEIRKMATVITVPFLATELSPLILTIPLQLLAYYTAVENGTDVDLPRNLAKSVTVE